MADKHDRSRRGHIIQGAVRRRSIWYESLKKVLALFELVILEINQVTIKQRTYEEEKLPLNNFEFDKAQANWQAIWSTKPSQAMQLNSTNTYLNDLFRHTQDNHRNMELKGTNIKVIPADNFNIRTATGSSGMTHSTTNSGFLEELDILQRNKEITHIHKYKKQQ